MTIEKVNKDKVAGNLIEAFLHRFHKSNDKEGGDLLSWKAIFTGISTAVYCRRYVFFSNVGGR